MQIDHWQHLFSAPLATGRLKVELEDFKVSENLGYLPCGQGEHIYLWVRKTALNTAYVAEQLAQFARVHPRAVTYAGRKDKYAITEQWFSVHKPGKAEFDWSQLTLEGVEVLQAIRHDKKLRTGVLKGNRFSITVRELSATEGLEQRLLQIQKQGVPNYYGAQRFGDSRYDQRGGNLVLAEKMIEGEPIRNRNKRSMAISALRSWLFNEYVSSRLQSATYQNPISGDVMILDGSASYFVAPEIDDAIHKRLMVKDIHMSAPLWGQGELASQHAAFDFEQHLAMDNVKVTQCLAELGLKQERRALKLFPQNMTWQLEADKLLIEFDLPAGAFATSVIRELVNIKHYYEVD